MSEVVLKFLMSSQARAKRSRLPRLRGREKGLFRAGPPSTCGLAPLACRLPRSGAGGEGAFPRVSVHRLRRVNPQALAGQKLSLPPQGQFAEKQPPRRLSGALLFRPFSWACKKKAKSKRTEWWQGAVIMQPASKSPPLPSHKLTVCAT